MATFTATEINALKHMHGAPNVVRSRLTLRANSFTVSDIMLMVRIPDGATVVDWKLIGGTAGIDGTSWSVGLQGDVVDAISGNSLSSGSLHAGVSLSTGGIGGAFITTGYSISATSSAGGALASINFVSPSPRVPFKVSLSDGAQPKYVWMQVSPAGSLTGSTSLQMIVTYMLGE